MPLVAYDFLIIQTTEICKLDVRIKLKNVEGKLVYYDNDDNDTSDDDSVRTGCSDDNADSVSKYGLQYYKIENDTDEDNKYYLIEDIFDLLDTSGHKIYSLTLYMRETELKYETLIDDFNGIFINLKPEYKIFLKLLDIEYQYSRMNDPVETDKYKNNYDMILYIIHECLIESNEDIKYIYDNRKSSIRLRSRIFKHLKINNNREKSTDLTKRSDYRIKHNVYGNNVFPYIDIEKELSDITIDDFNSK
jgi:hypothetical protein